MNKKRDLSHHSELLSGYFSTKGSSGHRDQTLLSLCFINIQISVLKLNGRQPRRSSYSTQQKKEKGGGLLIYDGSAAPESCDAFIPLSSSFCGDEGGAAAFLIVAG